MKPLSALLLVVVLGCSSPKKPPRPPQPVSRKQSANRVVAVHTATHVERPRVAVPTLKLPYTQVASATNIDGTWSHQINVRVEGEPTEVIFYLETTDYPHVFFKIIRSDTPINLDP